MSLPITTYVAACLAILLFGLAFATVIRRVKSGHSFGDGGDVDLQRAIRAHGNLIEYAPIFLLVLALLELQSPNETWLTGLGITFVTARVLHAVYFYVRQVLPLRIIAFWGSILPIVVGAIKAAVQAS